MIYFLLTGTYYLFMILPTKNNIFYAIKIRSQTFVMYIPMRNISFCSENFEKARNCWSLPNIVTSSWNIYCDTASCTFFLCCLYNFCDEHIGDVFTWWIKRIEDLTLINLSTFNWMISFFVHCFRKIWLSICRCIERRHYLSSLFNCWIIKAFVLHSIHGILTVAYHLKDHSMTTYSIYCPRHWFMGRYRKDQRPNLFFFWMLMVFS